MRIAAIVVALAALTVGLPTSPSSPISARFSLFGFGGISPTTGSTASELENGPCRPYTLIFARGTLESGNMGDTVGPALCDALKTLLGTGNVACQGVGGPYAAAINDNFLPKGTSDAAIGEATRLFNLANTKCPATKVIASGYSQGGAVMHGSISPLTDNLKSQIDGAVMFGDSRNQQDKGQIPNFPTSKTMIICALLDAVCMGTEFVDPQHFTYIAYISGAVNFLKGLL